MLHGVAEKATEDPGLNALLLDAPQLMGVESIELGTVTLRMVARTLPGKQFEVQWSHAELGAKLGYSGSHISSIERLDRVPVADFAAACDKVLGTPGTFARIHADIAREAYPPWFSPFVHFEQAASRVHSWDNRFFTGLLQCEDYARALIKAGHPDMPDTDIERDVAARTERQEIFERESPPACWFVIGEAAFRSVFGDDAVMRAQVTHVAELAARQHITVQVYPLTTPDCPGADGPLSVFDFNEQATTGYAEGV